MDDMLAKLKDATRMYRDSEKAVTEYTNAIRALAQVCEDEDIKTNYLLALEEISGKPGFADAVRSSLRVTRDRGAQTTTQIKGTIILMKKMDLSVYSNPMASIHTTLRRMKEKGEVEEIVNDKGEKTYRLVVKTPGQQIADLKAIRDRNK
ncbi:MAG TPA: hypothetical protein VK828_09530 [Terriglobales bacterium]|nr:hypothetical protein [Terriglobales bacterium]